ncbi:hypothetical protein PVA44_00165 [Entomospira nematocerorum]|uniref:Tetratricopeptide repeat protein n=1 Tax=Entomospira nematocerorum TaxID=2719987 RepID=A0A968GE14_9SPIO|nr:hypothetical protein [Entomospira nematocera]NIZ47544.1 hypothetical protein [Entomospira nematocera]WDI33916.1 hypothetical protein PVA44_00165 [Entomospira nematocera]
MSKGLRGSVFLRILLLSMALSTYAGYTQQSSLPLIQQYDFLSQKFHQSNSFSSEELWIMLQASYLIGDFQESKQFISQLSKYPSYKHQAQRIQLYIAIQEKDKNLPKLIQQAQRNPLLSQNTALTVSNAPQWLQSHQHISHAPLPDWDRIKDNHTALLAKRDTQPRWSPSRVIIERQLVNLFSQQRDIIALHELLPSLTLTKDKTAVQFNIAQLTVQQEERYHQLESVAQQNFRDYRIKANIELLFMHLEMGRTDQIQVIQNRLNSDRINKKDMHYQLTVALLYYTEGEYNKALAMLSQLIRHDAFHKLPRSIQTYLHELQAFSSLKTNQLSVAQGIYQQLLNDLPIHASTEIASILLQPPTSWDPKRLAQLQEITIDSKNQQILHLARIYHAYTTADINNMKHLLQTISVENEYQDIFHTLYALLYQYQNHFLLSANHFQKASKFTNQEQTQAQALLLSAQNYLQINQISTAHTQIRTLLEINDDYKEYIDIQFLLAQILLEQHQRKEALEILEQCYFLIQQSQKLRKDKSLLDEPSTKEVFLLYYRAYYEISPVKASEILLEMKKKYAHIVREIFLEYANILFNQGLYIDAINHFQQYIQSHPTVSVIEKSAIAYQIALAYELAENIPQAKLHYIHYLETYPQAPHHLSAVRRLVRLYSSKERANILSQRPRWMTSSTELLLFLAQQPVNLATITLSKDQLHWLEQVDTSILEQTEVITLLRLLAYAYARNTQFEKSLHFWYLVLEQSISKEEHWEARKARSHIFEHQDNLPKAVQEWIILASTIKAWPEEAYKAYLEAYQLCVKYHIYPQADIIYNRIREEFAEFID